MINDLFKYKKTMKEEQKKFKANKRYIKRLKGMYKRCLDVLSNAPNMRHEREKITARLENT